MKTGSHRTFCGPGRVSVSRSARGSSPGFRSYAALAPEAECLDLPREAYEPLYRARLAALDARKVWDDLHRLAASSEPVLLCWEVPPFTSTNWCHRRMIADWFADELGVQVEELEPDALRAQGPRPKGTPGSRRHSFVFEPNVASPGVAEHDGSLVKLGATVKVVGSKGTPYAVTNVEGTLRCGCPGFHFGRRCRHLASMTAEQPSAAA
jgi:hypothetical protein